MFADRERQLRLEALKLAVQLVESGYATGDPVEWAQAFYLFLNPADPLPR